ncbi:MAG: PAS domain-containing protein [Nitrospinae bacterium]|nr:PAS domain-containing protein [Nitrospinota bacterium]
MKIQPASAKIKTRITFLVITLLVLSLAAIGVSNYVLYRIALNQAGEMLGYTTKSNALFFEYSFRHLEEEAKHSGVPYSVDHALALYRERLKAGVVFGETGESVIARREGDSIRFFVHNRLKNSGAPVVIPFDSSGTAKPMKLALAGKSGTAITTDYRNITVLAAYEPLPAMNLAIVTKMDLAEIREPFLKGAAQLFFVIFVIIIGGAFVYLKVITPLIPLLMESEERLMTLVNGIDESLLFIDPAGKALIVNETAANRMGQSPSELIGHDVFSFFPPEIAASRRRKLGEALETGKAVHFDDERNGRHYHNSFFPVMDDTGRNIVSIVIHARDVTEQINAKNEILAAKEQAEKATRLKDKFVMLVSHDLKTPLVGMLGMMQLLQKRTGNPEDNRHCIDLAVQSNQRMIRMIDQLLDINRIRSGKLHLKCRYCDGSGIVREAVAIVGDMAAQKGITMQNMVPDRTMVIADPIFLQQVFCNLLTNAVKFSGPGKAVTIKFSPGEKMVFAVEDDGVGIAPDLMKSIFSYHDKTSTRGTHGEAGTGFGLPLSADIMEALNGKLKAESRPEGGTSFLVILPNPAPKLLIMESSAGSCDALKGLLEERGFTVTASPHALKILEMLEEERFDFLLVQLSGIKETGTELLRLVARDQSLRGMSLLAIGDSVCYGKNGADSDINDIMNCGPETAAVIERIYSVLMGEDSTWKG